MRLKKNAGKSSAIFLCVCQRTDCLPADEVSYPFFTEGETSMLHSIVLASAGSVVIGDIIPVLVLISAAALGSMFIH